MAKRQGWVGSRAGCRVKRGCYCLPFGLEHNLLSCSRDTGDCTNAHASTVPIQTYGLPALWAQRLDRFQPAKENFTIMVGTGHSHIWEKVLYMILSLWLAPAKVSPSRSQKADGSPLRGKEGEGSSCSSSKRQCWLWLFCYCILCLPSVWRWPCYCGVWTEEDERAHHHVSIS